MAKQNVTVDGLDETAMAFRRMAKEAPDDLADIMEDIADDMVTRARGRIGGRPGGGTYKRPSSRGIKRKRTGTDVDIVLQGDPTLLGAEFGTRRAWVFGRVMSASRLARRQYAKYNRRGYIVGDEFTPNRIAKRDREVATTFERDNVAKQLNRAGVPRG